MDNVAHALVGAAIGRAGLVRDIDARRGTWIGVISANVADLDLVEATWSGMDAYVLHHRGITHSFVGCVAGSILLTLIFRLRWQDLKMVPILLLCLLGYGSHLLMDVPTAWGTMLYLPWDDTRVALDWVFIVDLVYYGLAAAPWLLRRWLPEPATFRFALACIAFYVGMAGFAHRAAEDALRIHLQAHGLNDDTFRVYPAPLSPFWWNGVAYDGSMAHQTDIMLPWGPVGFDRSEPHGLDHPAVGAFRMMPIGGEVFGWMSSPLVKTTDLGFRRLRLDVDDMRFDMPALWRFRSDHPFRYSVTLWQDYDGDWRFEDRGSFQTL